MINYGEKLVIGTLNCRGMLEKAKREHLIKIMRDQGINILCLQETHVNTNHVELHEGHTFVFSSSVSDKDREAREAMQKAGKARGRGKGKVKGKGKTDFTLGREYHGVGAIIDAKTLLAV